MVSYPSPFIDIKASTKAYDDLPGITDSSLASIEKSFTTSALPERPDERKDTHALTRIREEFYK